MNNNNKHPILFLIAFVSLCFLLAACSSGGGAIADENPANVAPSTELPLTEPSTTTADPTKTESNNEVNIDLTSDTTESENGSESSEIVDGNEAGQVPANNPDDKTITENQPVDYSKIGFGLMKNDYMGSLKIGLSDKEATESIGEAEDKSDKLVWGSDALEHQTWFYNKDGIELGMVKEDSSQTVCTIKIKSPCSYKTGKNIGLDSTYQEVLEAYKSEIDKNNIGSDQTSLVAGTVYGGIIFTFDNGKVNTIFIGAAAE